MLVAHNRLLGISLFLFFLFSRLIVQFFKIQIIEGEKWAKAAKAQHQLVVIEPLKRGLFYSNASIKQAHPETSQPFVIDIPKFHLYVDPSQVPSIYKEEMIKGLCAVLSLEMSNIGRLHVQFEKKSRSRKLMSWLDREKVDAIQEWWFHFSRTKKIPRNALFFIKDYQRSYPFGKLLGPVLHTVRSEKDPQDTSTDSNRGIRIDFRQNSSRQRRQKTPIAFS